MIRRLSVLATFLLLAILQVCAAFGPPVGRFKLSIKNMYLDVDGDHPGSLAVLNPETTSTTWKLNPNGSIMHVKSGLFLSYTHESENARLILAYEPTKWRAETLKTGLQISAPECQLVVGMLPFRIDPPLVGLTKQDKEGSQAWKLLPPLELDPTPLVPEGYFHLTLANGHYLGVLDQEYSSPVFLLDHPSHSTIWEVRSEGPPDLVSIRNRETGLYLTYNPRNLDDRLLITPHKSVFRLLTIEPGFVQIVTGLIGMPPRAVAEMRPTRPGPPMAGLTEIRKDPSQTWSLRPVLRLDDSPRQYRLPFRRLRFW